MTSVTQDFVHIKDTHNENGLFFPPNFSFIMPSIHIINLHNLRVFHIITNFDAQAQHIYVSFTDCTFYIFCSNFKSKEVQHPIV